MSKKSKKKLNVKSLLRKSVPAVLIPGLLVATVLGWKIGALSKVQDYYKLKLVFPSSGIVQTIEDGDTFTLETGVSVRLLGINAPARGQKNYSEASHYLINHLSNQRVYLEYDRYQDDKYGRILAWVWVGCEKTPTFLPASYMHKSDNESNVGLSANPVGCKKGKLINEELVKAKLASPVAYKDRGELKYQQRLQFMLDIQSSKK